MPTLEHEAQRKIILKLIHNPSLSFNELWGKEGESNKFAYHLNKLEEEGLVIKQETTYTLTEEGKKLSAFIEGDTGTKAEFPTLTIVLIIKKDEKYLCQKRLKEPFYGYWGFVSGKINFGQNIEECAHRDLYEETGLETKEWKLKAIEQTKTFEESKLLFHHYMFILETNNPKGQLKIKTHKAEHVWLTLDEYKNKERFPGEWFFDHIIHSNKLVLLENERYMKEGKFISAQTKKIESF